MPRNLPARRPLTVIQMAAGLGLALLGVVLLVGGESGLGLICSACGGGLIVTA
jgi:hypothetical protein